jgi:hypothetical protein
MTSGTGRGEPWPSPHEPAQLPLPRLDELPRTADGYDPERVQEAFNTFYRHLAQLDTTLQTLEAVGAFRDQANELRRELRAFKTAGWTQQAWPPPYAGGTSIRPIGPGLPDALPRIAVEAGFIILVAVLVFLAHFDGLAIILIMALAWAIVAVVEWAATRERLAPPRPVATPVPPAVPAVQRAVAAPAVAEQPALADPAGWAAYSDPAPEGAHDVPDELTIVAAASEPEEEEPREAVRVSAPEPEAEAEPEPAGRDSELDREPVPQELEPAASASSGLSGSEPLSLMASEFEPELEPEPEPTPEPVLHGTLGLSGSEPLSLLEHETEEEADLEEEPRARRWFWGQDSERPEHEPADTPRRRFWRRRKEESAPEPGRFELSQPRHVRVLPPEPEPPESGHVLDPWEQEFDISVEEELEEPAPDRR